MADNTWATADEVEYIHDLRPHGEFSLADMLRLYLEAASRRANWDRIDRMKAIAAAENRLKLVEMREAA